MQVEGLNWRPKTRPTKKLRLNMKRILNPKLKKEKITVIEDSSSEENMENEEDSSSQQHYIQEDHLVSLELVQGGHKALEGKTTLITEQGIASEVSLVQEAMRDKEEDDLIFKKLDIPQLSNQDSIMHGEVHMDSEVENLRKNLQQHKSQIGFLNETNDMLVMNNRILREVLETLMHTIKN